MSYLIPVDQDTIDLVAKAIARERVVHEARSQLSNISRNYTNAPDLTKELERLVDENFEQVWNSKDPAVSAPKHEYQMDALVAINALNLKLLIS